MPNYFMKSVTRAVRYWYIPLLIGLAFVAIGIWVFATPLESYFTLAFLFSLSFLISGVLEIIFSLSNRNEMDNWGWTLLFGIIGVLAGILLLANPEISALTLSLYVAVVILTRSVLLISFSVDMKNYGVPDWGLLMALGILGTLFAFILLWNPLFAGLSLVYWTALAFVAIGISGIYLSLRLKKLHDNPWKISDELRERMQGLRREIEAEIANKKAAH